MILGTKKRIPWNKGKKGVYSEETLKKMSEVRKGRKLSKEHRRKLSLARKGLPLTKAQRKHTFKKGYKQSEETKRKIRLGNLGKKVSEETKRKVSLANKGKKRSEETKRKQSQRMIGKMNAFYGKKHSEESRKMMRQAQLGEKNVLYGKHRSEETRKKISVSNMGKKQSEETKRKISKSNKGKLTGSKNPFYGKTHSEETRKKISDSSLLQKAGPWKDTWGEKELQSILTANEIQFVDQKYFSLARHRVDIFIEPNICIEVDGDYFHGNPHPYSYQSKNHPGHKPDEILRGGKTAKEKWESDRRQTEALEQQCKQVVIRFYQSELETEPEKCLQKILKAIKESNSYSMKT